MKTPFLICLVAATTMPGLFAAIPPSARFARFEPIRVVQTTTFTLPETYETLEHPRGEATVMIDVDAHGQLLDLLVIRSTSDVYTRAAEQGLREWRFEPAREYGEPVRARQYVTLTFENRGAVVPMNASITLNRLTGQTGMRIPVREYLAAPSQLDAPVRAVNTVTPLSPAPQAQVPGPAAVTIDFIVDAQGRPRMPVVVATPNDVYAASAVDALEQWRFMPPTRSGRPVAVRVQQQFVFEPNSS